jgi:hypothetical protein
MTGAVLGRSIKLTVVLDVEYESDEECSVKVIAAEPRGATPCAICLRDMSIDDLCDACALAEYISDIGSLFLDDVKLPTPQIKVRGKLTLCGRMRWLAESENWESLSATFEPRSVQ